MSHALFCPNVAYTDNSSSSGELNIHCSNIKLITAIPFSSPICFLLLPVVFSDQTYVSVTSDSQLQRCHDNESLWKSLYASSSTHVFSCSDETVRWVREKVKSGGGGGGGEGDGQQHIQVLVTGSLHLVGSMIRVLGYQVEDMC